MEPKSYGHLAVILTSSLSTKSLKKNKIPSRAAQVEALCTNIVRIPSSVLGYLHAEAPE
jgi:hypothetical protein